MVLLNVSLVSFTLPPSPKTGNAVKTEVKKSNRSGKRCLLALFTNARSLALSKKTDTHMGDEVSYFRTDKDDMKFVCILFYRKCR